MLITQQTGQEVDVPCQQPGQAELLNRAQSLAVGFEFAQAVAKARNLDEVYLLLTNDIRCLIEFDRSFLIIHLGNASRFVAASALIAPEKKSRFYKELTRLAPILTELDRPVLTSRDYIDRLGEHGVVESVQAGLKSFMDFSESTHLFCLPLTFEGAAVGHLLFEFVDDNLPDREGVMVLGKLETILASALAQKWLAKTKPSVAGLLRPGPQVEVSTLTAVARKLKYVGPGVLVLLVVLFLIPFDHTVGGEAEVVAGERHVAFCMMDGPIQKIHVQEGSTVAAGAVLANIDPRDLEFKINIAQREFDILTREVTILSDGAGVHPSKLAQAQLTELNRKKKFKELEHLKSLREFLEVKSPVAGVVVTKHVETLVGKRFSPGEPFCEVLVRSELCADVYVPDDRITHVRPGQEVTVHLNSDPVKGYPLKLKEIAPRAEALPRFGNVFRARAEFPNAPSSAMVGMKGIGKIHTGTSSLWSLITDRLATRWNQFAASYL
ncbi:MAG: HlyD family efflux transporter periplasmic adaptor subunit [Desulfomonile tiedjei]|nr:HlyD family efflux transporter periplasmic adaptor subunit [Desulfomonile tiedjei]